MTPWQRLRRLLGWSYVERSKRWVMPEKFNRLAAYNTEVGHGIVHTPEWKAQMRVLQQEFDVWAEQVRDHL